MKIAILCPGYGIIARGAEQTIAELTTRLDTTYYIFDIYSRERGKKMSENIRIIHVPAISRDSSLAKVYASIGHHLGLYLRGPLAAESLAYTLSLGPVLLRRKYDLILNQAGPFAGRLCQIHRKIHGTPFIHIAGSDYGRLEEIMARQNPDVFVATSPYGKSWVKNVVPNINATFIPLGVDTELFSPDAGKVDSLLIKPPIILFVGAMDPVKKPDLTIEAITHLKEGSLLMIGDGPLREKVELLGLKTLGRDRFQLIPFVQHDSLPKYYNSCNLLTLPSDEAFGIVFIEAMACNKPVVAKKGPIQDWIIQDAGLTCNCDDPREYAETLRKALLMSFGNKPRERSKDFDWKIIAHEYADLFCRAGTNRTKLSP